MLTGLTLIAQELTDQIRYLQHHFPLWKPSELHNTTVCESSDSVALLAVG